MDDILDELLGKDYAQFQKVDAYLDRLEKVLRIKGLAKETGESTIVKMYSKVIIQILEKMTEELTDKEIK